jgi:hypothetical protein
VSVLSEIESDEQLSIDPDRGWTFETEEELFEFFQSDIESIEKNFDKLRKKSLKEGSKNTLEFTLERPDQIWLSDKFFKDQRPLWLYVKSHKKKKELVFCHCYEKEPTFIYLFFSLPIDFDLKKELKDFELIKEFSQKVGSGQVPVGALEGDSLFEGDALASGLYQAMMTLRNSEDLLEEDFLDFSDMREPSIEEADEIWRTMDSYGNNLVYFIKEFEYTNDIETEVLYYVVVTVEDSVSESNVLLFSFPTFDESLVDRYRVGENLQGDEVVQEGSH